MNQKINSDDFQVKIKHINTLFQFVKNNKEDQFIDYISNLSIDEIDVNMKDEHSNYIISFAIIINSRRIIIKIIEYGAKLDFLDSEGNTILYYPIKLHYPQIVEILMEADKKSIGISLADLKDARGQIPLFYAIKYRNHYALQELINHGADVNYKNNDGLNVLHLSVLKNDTTMVKMLIKYIKNVDAQTNTGETALHDACNFKRIEIVKLLLNKGANPNISNNDQDFYPIFYSVIQNDVDITKLLIDNYSDPNHQDSLGNTFVHYAILHNNINIMDYIFDKYKIKLSKDNYYDENINKKDASHNNSYIDPSIINLNGLTILQLLLYEYREDYDKYIRLLLIGSNLNYQDNSGNTSMHILIEKNLWTKYQDIIELKKINIFIKNNEDKTPIDLTPMIDREHLISMIVKSYFNYLKKNNISWLQEWQNKCAKISNDNQIDDEKCQQLIRESIIKGKLSIPIKKFKDNIVIDVDQKIHFTTFTGSILDMICGFKFLSKKYPLCTSLFHSDPFSPELEKYYQTLNINPEITNDIAHFEIRWIYQRLFFPSYFKNNIIKIINDKQFKYIIIPIGIIMSTGFDNTENHSNCLFYDINKNILERFEPHGSDYPYNFNYNPDLLDELIYKKFKSIIDENKPNQTNNDSLRYLVPKDYLPKFGFQRFDIMEESFNKNIGDPNGFCTLWCIWYLDFRLKYINIKPYKIIRKLINQVKFNNLSFRNVIRNYSKHIIDLRDSYLNLIGRNVNDYINYKITKSEKQILLDAIVNDVT